MQKKTKIKSRSSLPRIKTLFPLVMPQTGLTLPFRVISMANFFGAEAAATARMD
jgi:hypothetical protein